MVANAVEMIYVPCTCTSLTTKANDLPAPKNGITLVYHPHMILDKSHTHAHTHTHTHTQEEHKPHD